MMNRWRKYVVVAAGLLVFGAVRMPFEAELARDLRGSGLVAPPVTGDTAGKIGQTSYMVALGGLRSLVATMLNLRAFTYFTERKWDQVQETFDTIVDLAPRSAYYWEMGAYYQMFCASSYYKQDATLSPLRRHAAWRASILRGRAFLERGIRNNPGDPRLNRNLGDALTSRYHYKAFGDPAATFSAAADAYQVAADSGRELEVCRRFQLYALARVPARESEALALARRLYQDPDNHTSTMLAVYFALEVHANPAVIEPVEFARRVFGSAESAYREMGRYWLRDGECLPVYGMAEALLGLERELGVPAAHSVLDKRLTPDPGHE